MYVYMGLFMHVVSMDGWISMYVCTYGWMDGRTCVWVDGLMDVCMYVGMDRWICMYVCMFVCLYVCTEGWMDEWTDVCM